MTMSPDNLLGSTLEILSPTTSSTVCPTVTVCGQIASNKRKKDDPKNPDDPTEPDEPDDPVDEDCTKVQVTAGSQSCETTPNGSGYFCCTLSGLPTGPTTITAVYKNCDDEPSESIEVTVSNENCITIPTDPCDPRDDPIIIEVQTVPEGSQCRLSAQTLPKGDLRELETIDVSSRGTFRFESSTRLDRSQTYKLTIELLDRTGRVLRTFTTLRLERAEEAKP